MAENLTDTNVGNIEYIRKADASDWLKQYGRDVLHGKYKFSLMYIWKNIMDLPSADVVPVVRCKDCKHDISSQFDTAARCNLWGCLKPKRGFCDAGKRREE